MNFKIGASGPGEMARQFGALGALGKNLGLILSTHMTHGDSSFWGLDTLFCPPPQGTRYACATEAYISAKYSYT